MTTDYDRISADDLTHQTEEQLDQTEGGQTTGPVKTARKKATSSAKPASGKRTSKKRSRKTAAGQGAAEARAQAKRLADQQDILHQRIQTIFERGPAPDNGKRKRAAKAEATGLVWTLSALALAACGGGGGGGSSPAPVTGGEGRSSGPQPVVGGGNLKRETSETVANEVLSAADQKGLKTQLSEMTEMTVSLDMVEGAKTEDFTATGAYQVRTDLIDPNKMISVEVGGIIDPTTGVQVRGGGTDADGTYEGPSNWYSLPGSLLVTPITNYLARKYALEMHRDSLKTDNENSRLAGGKDAFFQIILDELFAGSGITVTLDDILDPLNYILPNKAEFDILHQARAGLDPAADRKTALAEKTQLADGSELSGGRTLADLDVADIVARKSLELFIHDLEGFADLATRPTRDKDLKDKLDELIQMARDIEDGKPLAIPLPGRTVAEDSADGYTFTFDDFGFSDPGGNDPDPDGNPQTDDAITSQFSAVRFVTASGRDDVALRPGEDLNPVSAGDITYDDYGRLYLKTYDSHNQLQDKSLWRALTDGDEVSVADIRAGNLVFIPAADFDRTAEFEIQVFDGETWSSPVRLFITVQPADDAPEFYSKATPPDALTGTDGDGRTKTLAKKHTQPLEVVAADGGVNLFAYQALADDADTKDSFAGITYALKRPADGEAETDDSALFVINADTGEVHFKVGEITLSTGEVFTVSAPDFERPHDLNLEPGLLEEVKGQRPDGSWHSDGTYVFTVIATSPDGSSVEQTVYLTVQNRNDEVTAHEIGSDHYLTLAAGEYLEVVKAGGEGWQGIPGSNPRTFESHIRINSQASDPSATVLFAYGSAAENDGGQWFIIEMNKDGVLQLNTNINTGTQKVPDWTRTTVAATHARIDDNAWYHIAVTYGAGVLTIWLDQVNVLSYEMTLNTSAEALFRLGDSTHLFAGDAAKNGDVSFDNFRIWDRVLDQEELIASSRIHKYGSSDLNKENTEQVPHLVLEYSFDRLESKTSETGEEIGTGEILDNAGNGHNARLSTTEGEIDDYAEVEKRIFTDPSRSGEVAVVVENSWLILSNEMFGISDADLADADDGVTFHMAAIDGQFEVWRLVDHDDDEDTAPVWQWEQSETFTLGDLKAGKVRFAHNGAENPVITIRYSVYDGLEDGAHVLGKPLSGGVGHGWARHTTTAERLFTIGVVNVNDRPEAADQRERIDEDASLSFGPVKVGEAIVDRFGFRDDDTENTSATSGNEFAAIQVIKAPVIGRLELQDANGNTIRVIKDDEVLTEAELPRLVFVPPADANSLDGAVFDQFTFRVWDGDDENSWSVQTYTYAIDVNERNDQPTIAANPGAFAAAGATEDRTFDGFVSSMFRFGDVDAGDPHNHDQDVTLIRIISLTDTAEGYLVRDNGSEVHLVSADDLFFWNGTKFVWYNGDLTTDAAGYKTLTGDQYDANNITAFELKFVPAPDFNGQATFDFTVLDRRAGQTYREGDERPESEVATFTLDVASVNDEAETAGDPNNPIARPRRTRRPPCQPTTTIII